MVPANCTNGDPKFQVLSTHEMEQYERYTIYIYIYNVYIYIYIIEQDSQHVYHVTLGEKKNKPVSFKTAARAAATAKSKARVQNIR